MEITILRIEDVNGGGCYRGEENWKLPCGSVYSERHPLPHMDSMLVESFAECNETIEDHVHHYYFGFLDAQQLRNWFYNDYWLYTMDKTFVISEVTIHEAYVKGGYSQICYEIGREKSKTQFSIIEYFNIDRGLYD